MTTGEQLHRMTEHVYRNTIECFNPEMRNLVSLGRSYEKSVQNVVQVAKEYFDAIVKIGELASETKGARQLGQSLLQIAETYRQIEAEREQTVHTLRKEVLTPVESKLEFEYKTILQAQKTYLTENKSKSEALDKCRSEVRKLQKKTQKASNEKYIEREQKSTEELGQLQRALLAFRSHGLRKAWTDERKRYNHIVERYCTVVKNDAAFYSKAQSVLHHRLSKWNESCEKADRLPEECEEILSTDFSGPLESPLQLELRHSRQFHERNIMLSQTDEKLQSPSSDPEDKVKNKPKGRSLSHGQVQVLPSSVVSKPLTMSSHEAPERSLTVDVDNGGNSSSGYSSATLPNPKKLHHVGGVGGINRNRGLSQQQHQHHSPGSSVSQTLPRQAFLRRVAEDPEQDPGQPQSPQHQQQMPQHVTPQQQAGLPRVQAMYAHAGGGDTQLSFNEGDIIALVGPTNNGWSFGLNMQTKRTGWFPAAYAQEISDDLQLNLANQGLPSPGQQQAPSPVLQQTPAQQQQQQHNQLHMNGSAGSPKAGSPMRSMTASSLDNILDPRNEYPAPDYGISNSPGLVQATSTMSLPQMPMSTQLHMMSSHQIPPSQQGLLTTVGRPLSDPSMQQAFDGSTGGSDRTSSGSQTPSTPNPSQHTPPLPDMDYEHEQHQQQEDPNDNPFATISLRKTVTNDRSAPMIPKDYALGDYSTRQEQRGMPAREPCVISQTRKVIKRQQSPGFDENEEKPGFDSHQQHGTSAREPCVIKQSPMYKDIAAHHQTHGLDKQPRNYSSEPKEQQRMSTHESGVIPQSGKDFIKHHQSRGFDKQPGKQSPEPQDQQKASAREPRVITKTDKDFANRHQSPVFDHQPGKHSPEPQELQRTSAREPRVITQTDKDFVNRHQSPELDKQRGKHAPETQEQHEIPAHLITQMRKESQQQVKYVPEHQKQQRTHAHEPCVISQPPHQSLGLNKEQKIHAAEPWDQMGKHAPDSRIITQTHKTVNKQQSPGVGEQPRTPPRDPCVISQTQNVVKRHQSPKLEEQQGRHASWPSGQHGIPIREPIYDTTQRKVVTRHQSPRFDDGQGKHAPELWEKHGTLPREPHTTSHTHTIRKRQRHQSSGLASTDPDKYLETKFPETTL